MMADVPTAICNTLDASLSLIPYLTLMRGDGVEVNTTSSGDLFKHALCVNGVLTTDRVLVAVSSVCVSPSLQHSHAYSFI